MSAIAGSGLRVIAISAHNYKRLVVAELEPKGLSVIVGGRNAQGKSSLLDAIADAIGGAKRGAGTELALRVGSVKGSVRVDLGEIVVTRTWTPGNDKLVVESPPGSPIKSPQAVLDKLLGDLSFDPLAFARMDPKRQAETLRKLAGLDTRSIEERRAAAYGQRTTVNGQLKTATTMRDQTTVPPEPPPAPPKPSIGALLEQQRGLQAVVTDYRDVEARPARLEGSLAILRREIAERSDRVVAVTELLKAADLAQAALQEAAIKASDAATYAKPLGVLGVRIDNLAKSAAEQERQVDLYLTEQRAIVAAARREIDEREQLQREAEAELERAREEAAGAAVSREIDERELGRNAAALKDADRATAAAEAAQQAIDEHRRALALWRERDALVTKLRQDADALTEIIERCDREKLEAIGAAKMPVEGLGIDGDVVTFRGIPLSQASQAERVRVGVAIGAALNPQLRVILVREGALLDDDSMRDLLEVAGSYGFQVWIETVGDRALSQGVGVIIEDGRIIATSEPAEPADEATRDSMAAAAASEDE